MSPQIAFLGRCIVTLVPFVWIFSTVSWSWSECFREWLQFGSGSGIVAELSVFFLNVNVSSNCLPQRMHRLIGSICLTFLHCELKLKWMFQRVTAVRQWQPRIGTGAACWRRSDQLEQRWTNNTSDGSNTTNVILSPSIRRSTSVAPEVASKKHIQSERLLLSGVRSPVRIKIVFINLNLVTRITRWIWRVRRIVFVRRIKLKR